MTLKQNLTIRSSPSSPNNRQYHPACECYDLRDIRRVYGQGGRLPLPHLFRGECLWLIHLILQDMVRINTAYFIGANRSSS